MNIVIKKILIQRKANYMSSSRSKKNYSKLSDNSEFGLASLLKSSLHGAIFALGLSVVLAFISCAIAFANKDPDALVFPLSMASLYISAFLGGLFSARKKEAPRLICGLCSGGVFMLAYMFISLFFPSQMSAGYSFVISLLLHSLIIVFSILGAMSYRKKNTHKRKRSSR